MAHEFGPTDLTSRNALQMNDGSLILYSQIFRPASPCAHSWPQVEAFAHAPLDREMTQPESGIHLRARNTGGLRGIALI
jgi:hypothetical protein